MNFDIDYLTFSESIDACCELIERHDGCHYVVTPNVDHVVRLETDEELRKVYSEADLVLTDGKPLVWISKLYGDSIPEKISGSDLFPALCARAAERGYSLFLLGAAEGVAARAADNLVSQYPGLSIAGTFSPEFGFEKNPDKVDETIDVINSCSPDILVVGLGCPKQEKFIYRNRGRLKAGLALGLGASIDFAAGEVSRAPKWMSEHGLEWLYRITQDPKRLAKRYLVDDMRILPLIVKYRGAYDHVLR